MKTELLDERFAGENVTDTKTIEYLEITAIQGDS